MNSSSTTPSEPAAPLSLLPGSVNLNNTLGPVFMGKSLLLLNERTVTYQHIGNIVIAVFVRSAVHIPAAHDHVTQLVWYIMRAGLYLLPA